MKECSPERLSQVRTEHEINSKENERKNPTKHISPSTWRSFSNSNTDFSSSGFLYSLLILKRQSHAALFSLWSIHMFRHEKYVLSSNADRIKKKRTTWNSRVNNTICFVIKWGNDVGEHFTGDLVYPFTWPTFGVFVSYRSWALVHCTASILEERYCSVWDWL